MGKYLKRTIDTMLTGGIGELNENYAGVKLTQFERDCVIAHKGTRWQKLLLLLVTGGFSLFYPPPTN